MYIYNIVTYRGFVADNNGVLDQMIGFIGTSLQLLVQPIIRAHNNGCLRLAPFLTGLRVSSLLRDGLGSDLRVGHFFSFRWLLSPPQLNTRLLNCLLNCLTNESLEFTNEFSSITSGGTNSGHHAEEVVFLSVVRCSGNHPLSSIFTSICIAIPAFRLFTESLLNEWSYSSQ
jgi:hypothetical protein